MLSFNAGFYGCMIIGRIESVELNLVKLEYIILKSSYLRHPAPRDTHPGGGPGVMDAILTFF